MVKWLYIHSPNFATGMVVGMAGYFSPVKGVVHVMVAAIFLDLILGVFAALKRGIGIKSHKLWRTGYKLIISIALVLLTFSVDKEMGFFEMHKLVAWVIVGFEVWSILESAGKITEHKAFRLLKKIMEDKIKEKTGVKLG